MYCSSSIAKHSKKCNPLQAFGVCSTRDPQDDTEGLTLKCWRITRILKIFKRMRCSHRANNTVTTSCHEQSTHEQSLMAWAPCTHHLCVTWAPWIYHLPSSGSSTPPRESVPKVFTIKIHKEMFNEIVFSLTHWLQQDNSAISARIFHLMRK